MVCEVSPPLAFLVEYALDFAMLAAARLEPAEAGGSFAAVLRGNRFVGGHSTSCPLLLGSIAVRIALGLAFLGFSTVAWKIGVGPLRGELPRG